MKSDKQFQLIECHGTPYEIGVQWGEGCRQSIHKTLERCFNTLEEFYQASAKDAVSMAMRFLPAISEFDPYLMEIMRGQADASGLRLEDIILQKCMNELLFYYKDMTGLCTCFAATGKATAGGKTIIGQNIDWASGATIDLLRIHHHTGLRQYILSFANSSEYTFSSSGFGNCANATIGTKYSFNLPIACYLPKVMRQKNVHDAMAVFKQVARGLGYYQLADNNGYMAGIESTCSDYEIIHPNKDLLLHTNHYITERFKEQDTAMMYQPDSYPRLERITGLMEEHYGRLTPEILMEILSDHSGHPESICRHVNDNMPVSSETLASFIMIPEDGIMFIACGNPCQNRYVEYAL